MYICRRKLKKKNTQRETVMCLVAEEGKVGNQSVRGLH